MINTLKKFPFHSGAWASLLLLCVAAVWGSSYGVAKYNLAFMPVLWFLALRFGLTFVLLLPALIRGWRVSPGQVRDSMRIGAPLGLLLLCIFLLETYGIAHTQASNAALLISLCVVFTPLVEWWLLQRRPSGSLFILSALCVLGVFLIVGKVQVFRQFGDSLMILAAVARALMVTLTQKKTRAISVDMLQLTAIQSGVVGLGCWILALSSSKGAWPNWPHAADFWGNTFYLVVFCTIFAFFVQNYAVKQVGASRTALLMGSEPMFGVLFAAVYLRENLSMNAYFGGLLIVSVSIWVSLQRARP